jgi:DNA repair protein RecN (Recombination protein N)
MLQHIFIKNFALIDELEINFQKGLNVILGETGAGKSIIIDALLLTLGERASQDLIRTGANKLIIEARFSIENIDKIRDILEEDILEFEDALILRREITSKGVSRSFINDTPCQLATLKELGNYLVDFHGQHSHQQLFSPSFQLALLDSLAGNDELIQIYKKLKKELLNEIQEYHTLIESKEKLHTQKETFEQNLQEIARINPQPQEIDNIENELNVLENFEIIYSNLQEAYNLIYSSTNSSYDLLSKTAKIIESTTRWDHTLVKISSEITQLLENIRDISQELSKKINSIEYNPQRVEWLRIRLSELRYLAKKYITYENIFTEKEKMFDYLTNSLKIDENIKQKVAKINSLKQRIAEIALQIQTRRKKSASIVESTLPEVLDKLGMNNTSFQINFSTANLEKASLDTISVEVNGNSCQLLENGIDKVEFLIATHHSMPPMPLASIASGGEISRIMLAIKSITAEHYQFPTMVFDEIDAGISGKIAQMAGILMHEISRNHQIIVITHIPQIASAGEHIILVSKRDINGEVKVEATSLNGEEKIQEIARLISGESISDAAIENAKNLINEFQSLI